MKSVVIAIGLFVAGVVAGYFVRLVLVEERAQRNLATLSGESLSRLNAVARFTQGFAADEIDHRWKELTAFTRAASDIGALKEAWQAWERAIIFQQTEKVGWSEYRNVIVHNSGRYLDSQQQPGLAPASDYAKAEAMRAADMIREAIPSDLLAKSGPFY